MTSINDALLHGRGPGWCRLSAPPAGTQPKHLKLDYPRVAIKAPQLASIAVTIGILVAASHVDAPALAMISGVLAVPFAFIYQHNGMQSKPCNMETEPSRAERSARRTSPASPQACSGATSVQVNHHATPGNNGKLRRAREPENLRLS